MLTDRQQQLLDFLRHHHRQTGIMPSTREIQKHFGFSSQTAAVSHLKALEKKGVIQRLAGKARAVIFPGDVGRDSDLVDIPIYGQITAGMASAVDQDREGELCVDPSSMGIRTRDRMFALRVRGESMINAHILDGDYVILAEREPVNRDIVAALIDGETTLKRFIIQDNRRWLKAENPNYPDLIPAMELIIQGVMVGLMRGSGRMMDRN